MSVDASQQTATLLHQASTLHQHGRLQEAQMACEQVLRLQPRNGSALSMLGIIALQSNDAEAALRRFQASAALEPSNVMAHLYQGMAYSMLGRHESAVQCYDRVIAIDPESSALPHYRRANALLQLKRYQQAVEGYDTAIALESDLDAAAYYERGIALQGLTAHAAAIDSFGHVLALDPGHAGAHRARIVSQQELGSFDAALAGIDALSAANPNSADLLCARGIVQVRLQRFAAAVESFTRALAVQSDWAPALNGRGLAFAGLEQYAPALADHDRAIACDPAFAEAHFNRGNVLISLGRPEAARSSFEAAAGCRQEYAEALYNLGRVNQQLGDFDAGLDAYQAAIRANGEFTDARINLGMLLKDCGDAGAALECFRRAIELDPQCLAAHANLAFTSMFIAEDPQSILAACRRLNERFVPGLVDGPAALQRQGRRAPGTRLRIGYVSPDFNDHCQSFFTVPLFEHHDRAAFEILCYSSVERPDGLTLRIKQHVDAFREVRGLDDAALASVIREDQVDILVDLTMHMAGGRPLLFARRPAPVQVAWLAYPGSTGIEAIDYRISDPRLDPPGFDAHYSERTIRLPDAFWCYDPLSEAPAVNGLPAKARGQLTLGCLNNTCKLTDRTLRLWAPVLAALPDARLLLMAPPGRSRTMLLQRARAAGIDAAKVEFVPRQPREHYLLAYHGIDLCLDTLPYNGHTTNLDSLWMGVPFVTRVGATCVGRAGLSLLHQIGLTELAADSDDAFAAAAIALARDPQRLASLRQELRPRLRGSPLMDGKRFAANLEHAYRTIHASRTLHA